MGTLNIADINSKLQKVYIIVMQRFRVVYCGIYHDSLVFNRNLYIISV